MNFLSKHPRLAALLRFVDHFHPGATATVANYFDRYEASGGSVDPSSIGKFLAMILAIFNALFPSSTFLQELEMLLAMLFPIPKTA